MGNADIVGGAEVDDAASGAEGDTPDLAEQQ
jgi:hypothetical protein